MEEEREAVRKSFIYTNWRGKSFVIDDQFARNLRRYLVDEGEKEEELTYITPEYLIGELPVMERWERHFQLEGMWEAPEAETDR